MSTNFPSSVGASGADVVQVGVSAQSILGVMPEAVRTARIDALEAG